MEDKVEDSVLIWVELIAAKCVIFGWMSGEEQNEYLWDRFPRGPEESLPAYLQRVAYSI